MQKMARIFDGDNLCLWEQSFNLLQIFLIPDWKNKK